MKTQLLSIDEIKQKLQTGEVTMETSCMGEQGGWEKVKDALSAEAQKLQIDVGDKAQHVDDRNQSPLVPYLSGFYTLFWH